MGSAEGEHSPSRCSLLAPAPYFCHPCGTRCLCYLMGMATSGWQMPWSRKQGALMPVQPAPVSSSHPLSHPGSHLGPLGKRKQGRASTEAATLSSFREGNQHLGPGITWVGDKDLPIYPQCSFSSYCKAFLAKQSQEHDSHEQCTGFDPLCKETSHPSLIAGLSAHTSLPATPALTIVPWHSITSLIRKKVELFV